MADSTNLVVAYNYRKYQIPHTYICTYIRIYVRTYVCIQNTYIRTHIRTYVCISEENHRFTNVRMHIWEMKNSAGLAGG